MKEQWRVIEGYPNYEVSNLGYVRNVKTGRVLRQCEDKDGYLMVQLWKDKKGKVFKVHRLVTTAFIPNFENKRTVNHINGIKTDNRVENLEWATGSENIKHAYKNGLHSKIQRCRCIETNQIFESLSDASKHFDCNQGSIRVSITKGYKVLKKYHFELAQ